jgi:hypothetical protein
VSAEFNDQYMIIKLNCPHFPSPVWLWLQCSAI